MRSHDLHTLCQRPSQPCLLQAWKNLSDSTLRPEQIHPIGYWQFKILDTDVSVLVKILWLCQLFEKHGRLKLLSNQQAWENLEAADLNENPDAALKLNLLARSWVLMGISMRYISTTMTRPWHVVNSCLLPCSQTQLACSILGKESRPA